ncbi:MAG TPA: zinc-binding dehydrogenase [Solirubrobacteraceae bacterium]|nr:zinc-binding dehydrogenase [Solirubrobacteraceae bacterium]
MRAALLAELKQPFVVEDVDLLDPTPGRVIVRTGATPFCSTDCINQRGDLGKVPPTILGHASIGTVEELGADVTHVRVGDRVLVPGTPECGHCFYCAEGRPDQCSELFDATTYFHVAERADGAPITAAGNVGGYAERMNVTANQAFPLHTDLPDDVLSLLGCGITSGVGAVFNVAEVKPGRSVAVFGTGHLGLWMIQGAKVAGAGKIIAVEPIAWRREMAGRLGATDLVDPADGDPVEQVRALTEGRGADYALEAAGPTVAQEQVFRAARRAGTVVLTGVERLGATVTYSQTELALQGRRLLSCQNGNVRMRRDLPLLVGMLEDGRLDAGPIITARYGLDRINDALAASAEKRDLTGVIVPNGRT